MQATEVGAASPRLAHLGDLYSLSRCDLHPCNAYGTLTTAVHTAHIYYYILCS